MSAELLQQPRARWVYAAAWLPVVTVYALAFAANGAPEGTALRGAVANLLPAALFGTAVLRTPASLPWREGRRAGFLLAHAGLLLAFLVACSAGWVALLALDARLADGAWRLRFEPRLLPFRALVDGLAYATLSGLAYAWHAARAASELAGRAARAEALRARAELEALRSQLNPHFILNTFHAVIGLVRREPAVAEAALERLGDLLRSGLRLQREGVDEVTLREEWAMVQGYLELERLRLGERLRVSFDASDEALECLVPAFALQTLAENAVRHAIAPRAAGGRLDIDARREGDRLRVKVRDDGPPGTRAGPGEGLGLKLLGERVAALHGAGAALRLERADRGAEAVLELPARRREERP